MDKQLFKAYVRTIVEEEVKKILPELLGEAVREIKQLTESTKVTSQQPKKPTIDRGRLAELMGISYDGETIRATTEGLSSPQVLTAMDSAGNKVQVSASDVNPNVVSALTRDYSQLMKAMKIA